MTNELTINKSAILFLMYRDADGTVIVNYADDFADHVKPMPYRIFPDWGKPFNNLQDYACYWEQAYAVGEGRLPAGWLEDLLDAQLDYDTACAYLSWVEKDYGVDYREWAGQDWQCCPIHGWDSDKEDFAMDYVENRWTMPENFDPHFLDADYIIDYFLRFETNEWYEDTKGKRAYYR